MHSAFQILSIIILVFITPISAFSKSITYPFPEGMEKAQDFRVWIDDKEISLYDTKNAALGMFSFSGEVNIKIAPVHDVKWLDIRPLKLGIKPSIENNIINFKITKPTSLTIELNSEFTRVLHLFANPLEESVPSPNDKNIKYFKAGKVYNVGNISLKKGENIYIEGGAVLRGSLKAENVSDVKIFGRGIIDGDSLKENNIIFFNNVKNSTVEGISLINSHTWTFKSVFCDNITVDNLKIVNYDFGTDGIDIVASQNFMVKNSFIRANDDCVVIKTWGGGPKYPEGIVIGPDVKNIKILNTVMWNMPWGNAIEIGFELRAKLVSDILFQDIDIIHVERGAALSIHNGDYANVQNIRFEDIRIEDAPHKIIDLAIFLSQYSVDRPKSKEERNKRYKHGAWDGVQKVYPGEEELFAKDRGFIKDIYFKNIIVEGRPGFSVISGYDKNHQVENVFIENLVFNGKKVNTLDEGKFVVENAKNINIK